MTDLLLNKCGDLKIVDGDFFIVRGADAVRQHWLIRVRTYQGEWILNEDMGVPYFQTVFAKNATNAEIENIFRELTLKTPGVLSVERVALSGFDPLTRSINLRVDATIEGDEHYTFYYDGPLSPDACPLEPAQDYPAQFEGLRIWFDAFYGDGREWDGTHLKLINKAGTGFADGAGSTGQPVLVGSSGINGHPAARFANGAGENQFLEVADTPAMRAATGFTQIVVYKPDSYSGSPASYKQGLVALNGNNNAGLREYYNFALNVSASGTASNLHLDEIQSGSPDEAIYTPAELFSFDPEIVVMRGNSLTGWNSSRNLQTRLISGTADENLLLDGAGLVGASYDPASALPGESDFLNGDIGEVLVYDRKLSDSETRDLVLYLRAKWGFTFSTAIVCSFGHGPFGHCPFGGTP